MSSSRRGGYGWRSTNSTHHQQNQTQVTLNQKDEQTYQTSEPHGNFEEKRPQNHRNPRRPYRNHNAKPHFVKHSEYNEGFASGLGSKLNISQNYYAKVEESLSGSDPKLEFEPNGHENFVKQEDSASGLGSKFIVDLGVTELCEDEKGKGVVQTVEALDTSDNTDEHDDDPVKRLEVLSMGFEETKLSDELLTINNQMQEDELLALESIYGDNAFILDYNDGLRCFQVHIHVEVPKGFSVSTELRRIDSSESIPYFFEVKYLSPIILTCLLPRSYPRKTAPLFTISVQWLNSTKISTLCCELDSIWQEQAGQEVIYHWVEWLHNSTFSHLGLVHEIVLGPYGSPGHDVDKRAISGCLSPDMDVPLMKAYSDEQVHENFCRNIQECCICFSEFPGSEFIKLPCQHFFCLKCVKMFTDIHIAERTVLKIQCPQAKCEGMIPPGLLKRLLGDEQFELWESLMLQKTLESMADVFYCPRCETACLEDKDHHAQCTKCFFSFCTLCRERLHIGEVCMTPEEKLQVLQDRRNLAMNDNQRAHENNLMNEYQSLKAIVEFARICPCCQTAVYKPEGCNKMECGNCGKLFCYLCNQQISGYDHYKDDNNCQLFAELEIEKMEARRLVGQIQSQLNADLHHPCPSCHQPNVKMGNNNHIFCWSCMVHYCYVCKKPVKRGSQHFGPNRCKQHSSG